MKQLVAAAYDYRNASFIMGLLNLVERLAVDYSKFIAINYVSMSTLSTCMCI